MLQEQSGGHHQRQRHLQGARAGPGQGNPLTLLSPHVCYMLVRCVLYVAAVVNVAAVC